MEIATQCCHAPKRQEVALGLYLYPPPAGGRARAGIHRPADREDRRGGGARENEAGRTTGDQRDRRLTARGTSLPLAEDKPALRRYCGAAESPVSS